MPPGLTHLAPTYAYQHMLTFANGGSLRLPYSLNGFRLPSEVHWASGPLPRSHHPQLSARKRKKLTHSSSTVCIIICQLLPVVKHRLRCFTVCIKLCILLHKIPGIHRCTHQAIRKAFPKTGQVFKGKPGLLGCLQYIFAQCDQKPPVHFSGSYGKCTNLEYLCSTG